MMDSLNGRFLSTVRREQKAVFGDKTQVERLLTSRSLTREMDEIAREAQDVPVLSLVNGSAYSRPTSSRPTQAGTGRAWVRAFKFQVATRNCMRVILPDCRAKDLARS